MTQSILYEIAALESLSHEELKAKWKTLFDTEPPSYNRKHLIKRIAYRIQENAYGGLKESAKEEMDRILDAYGYDEHGSKKRNTRRNAKTRKIPVPGTRFTREWNGTVHEVVALDGGFEYRGRRYRSLTAVVKEITGTHWNGRAFFGLGKTHTKKQGGGTSS